MLSLLVIVHPYEIHPAWKTSKVIPETLNKQGSALKHHITENSSICGKGWIIITIIIIKKEMLCQVNLVIKNF